MNSKQADDLTNLDQWFRYWMPYQFVSLGDERQKYLYLPLIRNYKPLGVTSRDQVAYSSFRSHAVIFSSDPALFADVWMPGKSQLYLYDDTPDSRLSYFSRLERLLAHSVKIHENEGRAS